MWWKLGCFLQLASLVVQHNLTRFNVDMSSLSFRVQSHACTPPPPPPFARRRRISDIKAGARIISCSFTRDSGFFMQISPWVIRRKFGGRGTERNGTEVFKDELGSFQLQRGRIRKFAPARASWRAKTSVIMGVLFCQSCSFFVVYLFLTESESWG